MLANGLWCGLLAALADIANTTPDSTAKVGRCEPAVCGEAELRQAAHEVAKVEARMKLLAAAITAGPPSDEVVSTPLRESHCAQVNPAQAAGDQQPWEALDETKDLLGDEAVDEAVVEIFPSDDAVISDVGTNKSPDFFAWFWQFEGRASGCDHLCSQAVSAA
jgi:hypothetical protein